MHNQDARRPGAWVGLLVFENLKTMMKAPMPVEGGAIAEVCFSRWADTPPTPLYHLPIIYPSFMQHIASKAMKLCGL